MRLGRFLLVLCVLLLFLHPCIVAYSDDTTDIKALVEKFFTLYQMKNLDGFMALWSEKSPEYASRKQSMQQLFASNDFSYEKLTISRIKVEADKASLRATVDMAQLNVTTKQTSKQHLIRTLVFMKEGIDWKVSRYYPAVDDLAAALIALALREAEGAKTEEERKALLSEEKELMAPELVQSLNRVGVIHYRRGNYLLALTINRQAQSIAEQVGDRDGIARVLVSIGNVHYSQGNYAQALELYQKSLKIVEEIGDKAGIARALNNIGNVHVSQGNHAQALEFYQKSLKIVEEIGDQAGIARALNNIGEVHRSQGNRAQALEFYQKSLKIVEEIGDRAGIALALNNIGSIHRSQGNYAQALEYCQKSLMIVEEIGDRAGIARALNIIGNVHDSQGNYTQALQFYQRGLKINEESGDRVGIANAMGNIGNVHHLRGNYAQALEFFQKSLKIVEETGDRAVVAKALAMIGNVHQSQGNCAQALEFCQKSWNLAEQLGDWAMIAIALHDIGSIHYSQGNYARALDFFQKSWKIAEDLGDRAGIASALSSIGLVHSSQGNDPQALEFFQKSLKISKEIGDRAGIACTLNNIGSNQGNYAQALEFYQKGLKIREEIGDRDGIARSLLDIGNVHRSQGNYTQAMEFNQKSLKITEEMGDRAGIARALNNIGVVHYLQGNHMHALEFFQRSFRISEELGDRSAIASALNNIGSSYGAQGQKPKAIVAYRKAIETGESLRATVAGGEKEQQRLFESLVSPYQSLVELLVEQGDLAEGLAYSERSKSRALLDVLQNGRVQITKAMTADEQNKEQELNSQLVSLNTQIQRESARRQPDENRLKELKDALRKIRLDYESFEIGLYASHPELKVKRGESKPITLDQAGELLPDANSALLEFVVTQDKTYLFVLTNERTLTFKVYPVAIKRDDLAERVKRLHGSLLGYQEFSPSQQDLPRSPTRGVQIVRRDKYSAAKLSARKLYDILLKPAQAQLTGKKRLIIVPDGVLWELPFQVLQSKDNHYLIEDAAISYAPSLTALREMERLRQGEGGAGDNGKVSPSNRPRVVSPTLLAMGNPTLASEAEKRVEFVKRGELQPLPSAEEEVKALGQLYGANSNVYVGKDATEERVKAEAGKYRLLHFATHGIVNEVSPMYSQIVLSHGPVVVGSDEDGLLEAWEIMKMDLQADLIVLSACETARGRVSAGEGMIGLTWALFVANCPSTVVTQWKVADESTTRLMVEFHRQLKSGKGKAEALRAAQLSLLHPKAKSGNHNSQWNHPYYWAPFVLIGDWR